MYTYEKVSKLMSKFHLEVETLEQDGVPIYVLKSVLGGFDSMKDMYDWMLVEFENK